MGSYWNLVPAQGVEKTMAEYTIWSEKFYYMFNRLDTKYRHVTDIQPGCMAG